MSADAPDSILIVEDLLAFRLLLREWLAPLAVPLVEVATLHEALLAIHTRLPAVIILDLILPDSKDIDTLPAILTASQHQAAIVVLTAGEMDARCAKVLGATSYMHKTSLDTEDAGRILRQLVLHAYAEKRHELRLLEEARATRDRPAS